jgi:hypothetical protein
MERYRFHADGALFYVTFTVADWLPVFISESAFKIAEATSVAGCHGIGSSARFGSTSSGHYARQGCPGCGTHCRERGSWNRLSHDMELCPHCQRDDHQVGSSDLRAKWVFMSGDLHTAGIDGELAMFHDPIVEEVRAIREQLAAQFNFDIRKIIEDAQRRQATSKSRIVSFERPKEALQTTGAANAISGKVSSINMQPGPAAEL